MRVDGSANPTMPKNPAQYINMNDGDSDAMDNVIVPNRDTAPTQSQRQTRPNTKAVGLAKASAV